MIDKSADKTGLGEPQKTSNIKLTTSRPRQLPRPRLGTWAAMSMMLREHAGFHVDKSSGHGSPLSETLISTDLSRG